MGDRARRTCCRAGADWVERAYCRAVSADGDPVPLEFFNVSSLTGRSPSCRTVSTSIVVSRVMIDVSTFCSDVITTGGSAQRAIAAIEAAGGRVLGVLAVVDREEGGRATLENEGREVVALVRAGELGLK